MFDIDNFLAVHELRNINVRSMRALLEPLGYTLRYGMGDWGGRLWIEGNGLPFLFNGFADECSDYSPGFDALRKMLRLGNIEPSTIIAGLAK